MKNAQYVHAENYKTLLGTIEALIKYVNIRFMDSKRQQY